MQELERQQKRAMSIICLGVSYYKALVMISFKELATQTDEIWEIRFDTITALISYYLYHTKILIH